MLALLTANCKVLKSTDPGVMLAQIKAALRDGDVACGRIRFMISHEDASVIDRITKVEPVLASHRRETSPQASSLSGTLSPQADGEVFDALCRVGSGIARRFRPRGFSVVFSQLDWGPDWLVEMPGAVDGMMREAQAMLAPLGVIPDLGSSIAYSNAWWVNGRNQSISARLIAQPPRTPEAAPLTVSDEILSLLNGFMKVSAKHFTLSVVPTVESDEQPDETPVRVFVNADGPRQESSDAVEKKRMLRTAALEHMGELCSSGRLPHVLEAPTVSEWAQRETGIPKKRIIAKALRPLGYEHVGKFGGQGLMCFAKITPANTKLLVDFDFGTWSPRIDVILTVSGATWNASLPLRFRQANDSLPHAYTPPTKEAFSQAIDNIAFVLTELETVFVAPLEAELGASPGWTASI
jgi:hypothetical protein